MSCDSNMIAQALGRHIFFDGISDGSRAALAEIAQLRKLDKKELLFYEGEHGSAIFQLIEGRIQLSKSTPEGKETVIRLIQPGEVFAEVLLFEKERYPVSATALAPSVVLALPRQEIRRLLAQEAFRDDFIAMLLRRQRYLTDRIQQLSACDLPERFCRFLRDQFGEQEQITPGLSKKDLALAIDTTPESLSRLLHRLEQAGQLHWKGPAIRIHPDFWQTYDPDQL